MSDEVNVTERILDKLNKIDDAVRITQLEIVEIKGDLKEHMSRTLAVEKNNELIDLKTDAFYKSNEVRITKLEKWSDKFHFLGWIIAGAVSVAEVGIRVIDYFKH